jgi:hypothetical protein
MRKLAGIAGLMSWLLACHAAKPAEQVTTSVAHDNGAPMLEHKPGRADVDPGNAAPPLAELIQTRVDPCARPIMDPRAPVPHGPNPLLPLVVVEKQCGDPLVPLVPRKIVVPETASPKH